MALSEWIEKYKEPRTEIRLIKGNYYKYEVAYRYSKDRKRTVKKTVRMLGKITEEAGFIPSSKDVLRRQSEELPKVDIKTFGIYRLFKELMADEIASMQEVFDSETCGKLFSFAMFRWAYQSPIKRAQEYHAHDYGSDELYGKPLTDKVLSLTLKRTGENREKVVEWMRSRVRVINGDDRNFILMDSTHTVSLSDNLKINAKGYNPAMSFDKQIRLMYMFSTKLKQPVYYRLLQGNIMDVKSMFLCVEEMELQDIVIVADKGFYSKENVELLDSKGAQYIIPLHRNNGLIDFSPIGNGAYKKAIQYFEYQDRIIWYYEYVREGHRFVTYIDEYLRTYEENDYLRRIKSRPEEHSHKGFEDHLNGFGTLTVIWNMHPVVKRIDKGKKKTEIEIEPSPSEIYETYKIRNEVEVMFDSYKNYMDADVTYMQNRYVLEGWLFANFLAMIAYYRLLLRLKVAGMLKRYSPKDIIEASKSICIASIRGQWRLAEMTRKTAETFRKIGIDYLT